mmetsp:Transcript_23390/g.59781  ORF Transcript_23390/g.59781 Transcript_23390/m.59781 type:complete len:316 (+) Transcript_23390:732-1679(+)
MLCASDSAACAEFMASSGIGDMLASLSNSFTSPFWLPASLSCTTNFLTSVIAASTPLQAVIASATAPITVGAPLPVRGMDESAPCALLSASSLLFSASSASTIISSAEPTCAVLPSSLARVIASLAVERAFVGSSRERCTSDCRIRVDTSRALSPISRKSVRAFCTASSASSVLAAKRAEVTVSHADASAFLSPARCAADRAEVAKVNAFVPLPRISAALTAICMASASRLASPSLPSTAAASVAAFNAFSDSSLKSMTSAAASVIRASATLPSGVDFLTLAASSLTIFSAASGSSCSSSSWLPTMSRRASAVPG